MEEKSFKKPLKIIFTFLLITLFIILCLILFNEIFIKNLGKKISKDSMKLNPNFVQKISPIEKTQKFYKVLRVIDGDTIVVNLDGSPKTIRLIGIDAPESVDPRKIVECFGIEASNKAKEILNGKKVSLEKDKSQGEKDKYGRLLAFVFLEDNTNFNKLMIKEGYAHEYTYQSNPYKYQKEFKKAEKEARINKKGLWADNACRG